jgi:MYXO-CTERM domain-containing protein
VRAARSLVVAALVLAAPSARAYCRTTTVDPDPAFVPTADRPCWDQGIPIAWKNASVDYVLQEDASKQVTLAEARAALDGAFAQWTTAACPAGEPNIEVRYAGATASRAVAYDHANVVMFDDAKWPYAHAADTLALTTVTYDVKTGELRDADMEINSAQVTLTVSDPVPAAGYDFGSIVTHEAGHFLGLAHSPHPKATMFAQYTQGSTWMRTLAPDDVAGVCAIYPPASGCSCATTPGAPRPAGLATAALLAALLRRRGRERRGNRKIESKPESLSSTILPHPLPPARAAANAMASERILTMGRAGSA